MTSDWQPATTKVEPEQHHRDPEEATSETTGAIAPYQPSVEPPTSEDHLQEYRDLLQEYAAGFADSFKDFLFNNKNVVVNLLLIVAAIFSIWFMVVALQAIEAIPFLSPAFELVGFWFTIWFFCRYIILDSTRDELGEELYKLRVQVLGKPRKRHK